ncbi:hypothetical protein V6N11_018720 [Hibiscus sabdariffa]|uniref:Uncharacterized protein n=1 Tax=Hibiscus sabdariffa TaxID=183260 RepID=A0ABR2QT48_9ROSI
MLMLVERSKEVECSAFLFEVAEASGISAAVSGVRVGLEWISTEADGAAGLAADGPVAVMGMVTLIGVASLIAVMGCDKAGECLFGSVALAAVC